MTDTRTDEHVEPSTAPVTEQVPNAEFHDGSGRDAPPSTTAPARGSWLHDDTVQTWVTVFVVVLCVGFVFVQLHPNRIFSSTTPAGGDMGAHVWAPAYLRDHLLPQFRLTGWAPDWYAGFPAFQFYMVLPSLMIALLSFVMPYGIAFKVVAVSGCVTMPASCWFFGRCARLPFPAPALLAVGGLLFQFDRSFSIYGGNIASTMAGEFAFSISLSLAIAYLAVLVRGFDTGRHRGWAALLLALTGLCHLIPLLFAGVCTVLWFVVRPGLAQLRYLVTVLPVSGALMGFWLLPFLARSGHMTDMGWEKITAYSNYLWSRQVLDRQLVDAPNLRWVIAFAIVGLLLSLIQRQRAGLFLALAAAAFAYGFVATPQFRLWNARLLPFYYLMLYLLAALGVAQLGRLLASFTARNWSRVSSGVLVATPVIAVLGVLVLLGMSLRIMPFGRFDQGAYVWGVGPVALRSTDDSFVDSWSEWNFSGYEASFTNADGQTQYRKEWPEYHGLMETMARVGRDKGCGRALWEHEDRHNRYGTPMALMLLPYWTKGCIGSMEGLYFEASATTSYHFLAQDELSWEASNAKRQMPYGPGPPSRADFDRGVRHLQMMGVRYYLAINENIKRFAAGNSSLTVIATSGPWNVYEVADAPLVEGLANRPAVIQGQQDTGEAWLDSSVCWWVNPSNWDVVLTNDGPADWERIERTNHPDPEASPASKCQPAADWGWLNGDHGPTPVGQPPVKVSNLETSDNHVAFDVDQPGTPVLVKVSAFPNWKVTGAEGPYRAAPNFMVVVPQGNHVELTYGYTPVDALAYAMTALGLFGLVLLFRARPLTVPAPGPFWARGDRSGSFAGLHPDRPELPSSWSAVLDAIIPATPSTPPDGDPPPDS